MTEDEIHKIATVEQSHWWYRGTREICFSILEQYVGSSSSRTSPPQILDVGCGTGGNLLALARFGSVKGIDIDPLCVDYCRRKGLDVSLGTMADLRQPAASVDLLTMFDVLYHCEPHETVGILRGMADVVRPGGLIAFREPAMDIARGWHDRAVNGRQRFSVPGISRSLRDAGFEPLRVTYLNTILFPPIVAVRRLQDLRQPSGVASDVEPTPEPINALLLGLLRLERAALQVANLPFGVSLFAVARRR